MLTSIGPQNLPRLSEISLDPTVLGFSILAAAFRAGVRHRPGRSRLTRRRGGHSPRGGRSPALSGAGKWLRAGVVTAAVSLAFVLLVGSGLMIRSFVALQRAAPGFDASSALTFVVANFVEQTPEAHPAARRRIQEALAAIPGVTAVSAASSLPLDGGTGSARWGPEAALDESGTVPAG